MVLYWLDKMGFAALLLVTRVDGLASAARPAAADVDGALPAAHQYAAGEIWRHRDIVTSNEYGLN